MSARKGETEGVGPFQLSAVRQAEDIPGWVWDAALPKLKEEFKAVQRSGDIPTEGGSVDVVKAPPRERWSSRFCSILEQFDGREQPTEVVAV